MSDSDSYNFSICNLILTVGGQLLVLIFLLIISLFGVPEMEFPKNQVKQALQNLGQNNPT
jgi:hypothetical protein